jgi:hypothetical protein
MAITDRRNRQVRGVLPGSGCTDGGSTDAGVARDQRPDGRHRLRDSCRARIRCRRDVRPGVSVRANLPDPRARTTGRAWDHLAGWSLRGTLRRDHRGWIWGGSRGPHGAAASWVYCRRPHRCDPHPLVVRISGPWRSSRWNGKPRSHLDCTSHSPTVRYRGCRICALPREAGHS